MRIGMISMLTGLALVCSTPGHTQTQPPISTNDMAINNGANLPIKTLWARFDEANAKCMADPKSSKTASGYLACMNANLPKGVTVEKK